ncbi:hypothetical protein R1flu_014650 [Riccia fluitans]|uniref:Uncharacterized protein n=1 Tax=Riccia fluitans TaxID=41844 RepID=A0ABD1YK20_9MARC
MEQKRAESQVNYLKEVKKKIIEGLAIKEQKASNNGKHIQMVWKRLLKVFEVVQPEPSSSIPSLVQTIQTSASSNKVDKTPKTMHISTGGSQEYAAGIGPSTKYFRFVAATPSIGYNLHAEPLASSRIKLVEIPKDINPIAHGY